MLVAFADRMSRTHPVRQSVRRSKSGATVAGPLRELSGRANGALPNFKLVLQQPGLTSACHKSVR